MLRNGSWLFQLVNPFLNVVFPNGSMFAMPTVQHPENIYENQFFLIDWMNIFKNERSRYKRFSMTFSIRKIINWLYGTHINVIPSCHCATIKWFGDVFVHWGYGSQSQIFPRLNFRCAHMLCIPHQWIHVVRMNSQHGFSFHTIDSFMLKHHRMQLFCSPFFSK